MTVMNLDKLEVWVRAKDFAAVVYKEAVPHLPADEKWNLIQQLNGPPKASRPTLPRVMGVITLWIMSVFVTWPEAHWPRFKVIWLWLMSWAICPMKSTNVSRSMQNPSASNSIVILPTSNARNKAKKNFQRGILFVKNLSRISSMIGKKTTKSVNYDPLSMPLFTIPDDPSSILY
jgi:hypothetical protein